MKKVVSIILAVTVLCVALAFAGCAKSEELKFDYGKQTVEMFFDSFKSKDYDTALKYLGDDDARGLNSMESFMPIVDAIAETMDYKVLSSKQSKSESFKTRVEVTTVDVEAVVSEIKSGLPGNLADILSGKSVSDYVDEIAQSIRSNADNTSVNELELEVKKNGDEWIIDGGGSLITSIVGGATDIFDIFNLF